MLLLMLPINHLTPSRLILIFLMICIRVFECDALGEADRYTSTGLLIPASTALPHRKNGHPMTVNVVSYIGRPGALLFSREVTGSFVMNYTLKCRSLDTVYALTALTLTPSVARINNGKFNVTCESALPFQLGNLTHVTSLPTEDVVSPDGGMVVDGHSEYIGYVQGQINVSVVTGSIGRSFLLVLADKITGLDPTDAIRFGDNDAIGSVFAPGSKNGQNTSSAIKEASSQSHHSAAPGKMPLMPPNTVGRAMVIVMQLPRTIDTIFRIVLYIVIVLATTGMGVNVEISVIKAVLRRPVAPIIGLVCQYVGMPLIAFMIAKTIPQDNAAISLGIFTCGISPGGGPSNMFTYLLGGDLSLSIAMTTISSIAALAMIPFWIFTLGSQFKDDTVDLKIPYENILETLAIAILPIFLGIFIKYKIPKLAKIIRITLKPVLLIVVLFMTSLGIYTNLFIFKMIKPMTIAAGCMLPYIGYIVGGLVAFLFCQSWSRVKTIAIETGIQNMGVAFLIVYLSLPPPDNQLAVVGPASSTIMTPLPLLVLVFFYFIYQRMHKKKTENSNETKGDIPNDEESKNLTITQEEKEILPADKKSGIFKMFKKNKKVDKKSAEKLALKKLAEGDGTAAIVVLWQKLTKSKPLIDPVKVYLDVETEVASPEIENWKVVTDHQNGETK
ncbi:hypothetical protein Btru_053520 [Bulinus truncatus]|nr:hypothetical protein Btru_053520 [Bulinus truncatus]